LNAVSTNTQKYYLQKEKGNGNNVQYYMLVLRILRIWLISQQDCGFVAHLLSDPGDYHDIQLEHMSVGQ
jgi:hypothetical protein